MHVVVPLIAAFFPTALYTLVLWWLDRYEKEPIHLLLVTFVWGAVPALALAVVAELALDGTASTLLGPEAPATVVAPVIEETLKALVLIGLFIFARREFNGVLDGIIYGALVGFGFAMSENILYFIAYRDQLIGTWLLRSIVFGFNHAFYTSIVGIALGMVRYERRRWVGYVAVPLALWLAILLHSLHNVWTQLGLVGYSLAWLVDSGGVLVVLATIVLSQRQERTWISAELSEEVQRGTITPAQFDRALRPAMRSRVELQILLRRGWLQYRRMRRFHHLLTELAYVKHQLHRHDRFCRSDDVEDLRVAVLAIRRLVEDRPAPASTANTANEFAVDTMKPAKAGSEAHGR